VTQSLSFSILRSMHDFMNSSGIKYSIWCGLLNSVQLLIMIEVHSVAVMMFVLCVALFVVLLGATLQWWHCGWALWCFFQQCCCCGGIVLETELQGQHCCFNVAVVVLSWCDIAAARQHSCNGFADIALHQCFLWLYCFW